MAPKNKIKLESRFPAVKKAAYETVQLARAAALEAGQETAQSRIDKQASQRGYNLDELQVQKETIGFQSGKIFVEPWWARFFEYGTVYIKATPFMRPGHRKMRKVFVAMMAGDFEKWVRRRARLR